MTLKSLFPRPVNLLVYLLLLILSFSISAVELMKWERIPLPIKLHVNQERIVFVNKNVRVGFPESLNNKLRVQSTGGVIYLFASDTFTTTRIQLQDTESGELILMDIQAQNNERALEPVKLIYQGDVLSVNSQSNAETTSQATNDIQDKQSLTKQKKLSAPLATTLIRYAAQSLYAPLRTRETIAGIKTIPPHLPSIITTLLPTERITVTPLSAWSLQGYSVVALKLVHQQNKRIELDPRHLQGSFYSAVFQHQWLGAKGTPEDTTSLYLVTKGRPANAFIPEPIVQSKERKNAD